MNVAAVLALAIVLCAIQSSGVAPITVSELSADLVLCLVVRLSMTRSLPVGGAMVLAIGLLMDAASGAPLGIHLVVFIAVFLAGYGMRHRLFLDSVPTIAAAAFCASLFATLMTWFLVAVFLEDYHQYGRFAVLGFPRALLTVPFMFPIRSAAAWIDDRTFQPALGSA